jgi:hypothetical protein
MPFIIVIDKTGKVKETNLKEYNKNDLYKKANFKSAEGFLPQHKWEVECNHTKHNIVVYAKKNGKAGQENKYEFPPPIDSILFFGGCVLISEDVSDTNKIINLRVSDWNSIYENLMGGFEDLEEDDEEDDEDKEPNEYVCDDFVVEDDDIDYDDLSAQEEDDEEEIITKKKNSKTKNKKNTNKNPSKKITIELDLSCENENTYLDCQSELEEEEYFA